MSGQRHHEAADLAAALHWGGDPVEPRSDCPATERMWDAVAGQLSTTERLAILDHSIECAACADSWRLVIEFQSRESTSGIREAGHARVRLFSAALFKVASLAAAAIAIVAMGMLFAGRTDRKRIDSAVNDPARPNGSAERSPANAERSEVPGAPGNGTAASATAPTDVVTILRQGQPDGEGTREGRAGQLSPADGHADRFAAQRQAARRLAEIEGQIRAPNPSALDPAEVPGRTGPVPTVVRRDDRPDGTASGRNPDSKATGGSAASAPASGAASFDDLKSRLQGAIDVGAVAEAQRLLEEMLWTYPSAPDTERFRTLVVRLPAERVSAAVQEFVAAIERQDEQTLRRLLPTGPGEARPRMAFVSASVKGTEASVVCRVFPVVTSSDGGRTESKIPEIWIYERQGHSWIRVK